VFSHFIYFIHMSDLLNKILMFLVKKKNKVSKQKKNIENETTPFFWKAPRR